MMQTLREHQLYAKYNKCDFFKEQIQYLGHIITKDGIAVEPEKIKTIMEWPIPKDVADIRSFMGLASYYRRFVEGFSRVAYPITSLQKKGKAFKWTTECQKSFEQLKHLLTTTPILSIADPAKDYVVCTDARWVDFLSGFDFEIKHLKGKENRVANTLSRKAHCLYEIACSGVQTTFDDMIKAAAEQDLKFQQTRQ
eukprot:PITA_33939